MVVGQLCCAGIECFCTGFVPGDALFEVPVLLLEDVELAVLCDGDLGLHPAGSPDLGDGALDDGVELGPLLPLLVQRHAEPGNPLPHGQRRPLGPFQLRIQPRELLGRDELVPGRHHWPHRTHRSHRSHLHSHHVHQVHAAWASRDARGEHRGARRHASVLEGAHPGQLCLVPGQLGRGILRLVGVDVEADLFGPLHKLEGLDGLFDRVLGGRDGCDERGPRVPAERVLEEAGEL